MSVNTKPAFREVPVGLLLILHTFLIHYDATCGRTYNKKFAQSPQSLVTMLQHELITTAIYFVMLDV